MRHSLSLSRARARAMTQFTPRPIRLRWTRQPTASSRARVALRRLSIDFLFISRGVTPEDSDNSRSLHRRDALPRVIRSRSVSRSLSLSLFLSRLDPEIDPSAFFLSAPCDAIYGALPRNTLIPAREGRGGGRRGSINALLRSLSLSLSPKIIRISCPAPLMLLPRCYRCGKALETTRGWTLLSSPLLSSPLRARAISIASHRATLRSQICCHSHIFFPPFGLRPTSLPPLHGCAVALRNREISAGSRGSSLIDYN